MGNPRINVLCIVGAMIGITCILTTWALVTETPPGWPDKTIRTKAVNIQPSGWSMLDALIATLNPSSNAYGNAELIAYILMFMGGAVASFLTPLGGVPQLAGAIGFYTTSQADLFVHDFGAGFVIAIVSAAIVLTSIVWPMGVGYDKGPIDLRARLLTFTRA